MEETKVKLRRPVLAALLSLLTPGLGQLYNGELKKGITFYVVATVIQTILVLTIIFPLDSNTLTLPVITIIVIIILSIIVEAVVSARKLRKTQLKYYNQWYIYASIVILCSFSGLTPLTLKVALSVILATAFSLLNQRAATSTAKKQRNQWYLYLLLVLLFGSFSGPATYIFIYILVLY